MTEQQEPQGRQELTAREIGRRGGQKLLKKYGREHYVAMGKKGGRKTLENNGTEHFQKIGEAGGRSKARKVREEDDLRRAKPQIAVGQDEGGA